MATPQLYCLFMLLLCKIAAVCSGDLERYTEPYIFQMVRPECVCGDCLKSFVHLSRGALQYVSAVQLQFLSILSSVSGGAAVVAIVIVLYDL